MTLQTSEWPIAHGRIRIRLPEAHGLQRAAPSRRGGKCIDGGVSVWLGQGVLQLELGKRATLLDAACERDEATLAHLVAAHVEECDGQRGSEELTDDGCGALAKSTLPQCEGRERGGAEQRREGDGLWRIGQSDELW